MPNTIVAGNGNTITPDFDAVFRDMILGTNGHNVTLTKSGASVTDGLIANGLAFAHGVVGVFKNAQIGSITGNGYIYAKLTVYHDETVKDEANIYFTDVQVSGQQPDISIVQGEYNLLVATIVGETITVDNYVTYPERARNADYATNVTGTIAGTATAVTQAVSDDSAKVATTAFVQDVLEANKQDSIITITDQNFTATQNTINYRLGAAVINLEGAYYSVGGIWGPITIGTVPFPPSVPVQCVAYNASNYWTVDISTSGNITVNISGGALLNRVEFTINCGYLIS